MGGRSRRLIILDPSLHDLGGGCFEKTKVLVEKAVRNGCETLVYASKSFDSRQRIAGASVRSVFGGPSGVSNSLKDNRSIAHMIRSLWRYQVRDWLPMWLLRSLRRIRSKLEVLLSRTGLPMTLIPRLHSRSAGDELRDALCLDGADDHDHIVVHTSDAFMYRTILQFLLKAYPNTSLPRFHISTPYDLDSMPASGEGLQVKRVVSYLQQMGCINRCVYLYAESRVSADSLSSGCHVEVADLGAMGEREINDEIYYPDIADKLLLKIAKIDDADNDEGVAEQFAGSPENGVSYQDDVPAENGYNVELIEAVESKDGHALYIKQIKK